MGGGFGGLQAALKLSRMPVEVTLIDRRNFHLFQPLAYQVATGALSAPEICYPLRRIFRRRRNVRVVLAEVTGFDLENRRVRLGPVGDERPPQAIPYDMLIVSVGARYIYFGHDEWQRSATDLKTLEGALAIRRSVLEALEAAELEADPKRRAALVTFVLVGAGPTGVEMAGQIAEIAHDLKGDFRSLDLHEARILLVETGDRVLQEYPPSLSAKALRQLQSLGVTVRLSHTVTDLDDESVTLRAADGSEERIATHTVVWAAGVLASELASLLAEQAGLDVDRTGRVEVSEDLSLPRHPEVLAIGDMIRVRQASGPPVALPGVAPVAMQEGRHAAAVVKDRLQGQPGRRFHYFDKGNLATIGRARAVADLKGIWPPIRYPPGIHLSGFTAWVTWLTVHLFYMIGFENRLLVVTRWAFSFATHGRGARLIAGGAETPKRVPEETRAGAGQSDVAAAPGGSLGGGSHTNPTQGREWWNVGQNTLMELAARKFAARLSR